MGTEDRLLRNYAFVKPELLIAARKRLRMSEIVAAKKLGVSMARLRDWETGTAKPTIRQLRVAARVYRQSLAFFFLSAIPADMSPSLKDFRRLPADEELTVSPELAREVRECGIRRDVALELLQLRGDGPGVREFAFSTSLQDSPEETAERLRAYIGLGMPVQASWSNTRLAFNAWRLAIEQVGVLVFQAVDVPVEHMRGFSIAQFPLPAIVVNRKDAYAGRTFSLVHEMVHLALRTSALCDLADYRGRSHDQTEIYCNHVAGAALVPGHELRGHPLVRFTSEPRWWSESEVTELAQHFSVSREALARRLLILRLAPPDFYREKRREYGKQQGSTKSGYVPPSTDSISKNGRLLVRLVIESMHEGRITPNDASDYLGVRLKHFDRIETQVGAS